jgi:ABC-2 type transport system permease protein
MRGSVSAELLLLRKRRSTWILLGIWTALATFFSYLLPYVEYRNGDLGGGPGETPLEDLLPGELAGHLSGGFPFFGGVFALMLGVLALGSEYGWGTLRTVLVQRPGRLQVFAAKLLALAAGLVPFVLAVYAVGTLASYAIAWNEGVEIGSPSAWDGGARGRAGRALARHRARDRRRHPLCPGDRGPDQRLRRPGEPARAAR